MSGPVNSVDLPTFPRLTLSGDPRYSMVTHICTLVRTTLHMVSAVLLHLNRYMSIFGNLQILILVGLTSCCRTSHIYHMVLLLVQQHTLHRRYVLHAVLHRTEFCTSCKSMQYIETGGSWCSSRRRSRDPLHMRIRSLLIEFDVHDRGRNGACTRCRTNTCRIPRQSPQSWVVPKGSPARSATSTKRDDALLDSAIAWTGGLIVDTTVFVLLPCKTVSVGRGVQLLDTMMRNVRTLSLVNLSDILMLWFAPVIFFFPYTQTLLSPKCRTTANEFPTARHYGRPQQL
ncbi:hypothetical protein EDB89DRAFT_1649896 [Lactarius sanguifluus]|nr:hypothetical protein EDB89DRAFT_1649896 [Lactarius sanguifluus]